MEKAGEGAVVGGPSMEIMDADVPWRRLEKLLLLVVNSILYLSFTKSEAKTSRAAAA